MKTLYSYLQKELNRCDPCPAIDHEVRAELHEDGRISFYIHAKGRNSDTPDFWVACDGTIVERRLADEPLSQEKRDAVAAAVERFKGGWNFADNQRVLVPDNEDLSWQEIKGAIESVPGVCANYLGFNDIQWEFCPRLGTLP